MKIANAITLRLWGCFKKDCLGQDLMEYALISGFVAVAVVGLSPGVASSFAIVWSKVNSVATLAASS